MSADFQALCDQVQDEYAPYRPPKHRRPRDRRALYVFAALAIEQGLDVLTTKYALGQGNHEANPVAANYVHLPIAVLLAVKVGFALGGYIIWRRLTAGRERVSSLFFLPLLCTIGLYAYIITSNVAIDLATRT